MEKQYDAPTAQQQQTKDIDKTPKPRLMALATPSGGGGGGGILPPPTPNRAPAQQQTTPGRYIAILAQNIKSILMNPSRNNEISQAAEKLADAVTKGPIQDLLNPPPQPPTAPATSQGYKGMEAMTRDIYKVVLDIQKKADNPKKATWAQIATGGIPTPQAQTTRTDTSERQFTIKIAEETERGRVQATEAGALLQAIKGGSNPACKDVQGIRKLASGDLLITTGTHTSKETLQKNPEWITVVAASAKAPVRMRPVEVINVRLTSIKLNTEEDRATTQKKILRENSTMHVGLKIGRIAWQKKNYPTDKTHASLIIDMESAEAANELIERGIVIDYDVHTVAPYSRSWEIKQCFKCQGYGHIAQLCRKLTICGHCAGEHPTQDCKTPEKTKCANCKKDHTTWDNRCRARIDQRERLRAQKCIDIARIEMEATKRQRRAVFQGIGFQGTRMGPPKTATYSQPNKSNPLHRSIWTATPPPQKNTNGKRPGDQEERNPRGRPTHIQVASRERSQSQIRFSQPTSLLAIEPTTALEDTSTTTIEDKAIKDIEMQLE